MQQAARILKIRLVYTYELHLGTTVAETTRRVNLAFDEESTTINRWPKQEGKF